jgi:hypothetical protein
VSADAFAYEARVWDRAGAPTDDDSGWDRIAWCPTREYAELMVEAAMVRYGYGYGEVWGPSTKDPSRRVALVRYDR